MGKVDHGSDGNQCQPWSNGYHENLISYADDTSYSVYYYDALYDITTPWEDDDDNSTTETHNYCR